MKANSSDMILFFPAMLSSGRYATLQLNYWIGATDQTQEGGWHWTDNTPFRYKC